MTQTKTSKSKDWHQAMIVAQLRIQGTSLRKLSTDSGFNPTALSVALKRPWLKAEGIIAKAIGVKPAVIWPSRYQHRQAKQDAVEANKRKGAKSHQSLVSKNAVNTAISIAGE